eukprot:TRINITY_DN10020_c0_g1_i1.p1 TRINITY_DN10020_c0_g1~~TRINITY_DN10020_c0_g1_i1.p1  ORF type:complete len:266 (+),score=20.25 TRINITY_DN10020_c0_g1_i1:195-992(+)
MGCASSNPQALIEEVKLPPDVFLLGNDRVAEAVEVAARSFAGTAETDPEWAIDWVLGPHLRGKWDDPRRLDVARWMHRTVLRLTLNYGGIVLGAKREDGRLGAVCVTMPYLRRKRPIGDLKMMMRYMRHYSELGDPPYSTKPMSNDIGKGIEKRFDVIGKEMSKIHKKHAPRDHWYVAVMAVDTDAQGNGYCGKLMRTVSLFADKAGVPCYLETSGKRNVSIYERFGYRSEKAYTLSCAADPDNAPAYNAFHAMVRQANTGIAWE